MRFRFSLKRKHSLRYIILGCEGSGKTTLYNILTEKQVGQEEQTLTNQSVKDAEITVKDKIIRLCKAKDLPGGSPFQENALRALYKRSKYDVIIYMINLDDFFKSEKVQKTVAEQLDTIHQITKDKKDVFVFVIGNFVRRTSMKNLILRKTFIKSKCIEVLGAHEGAKETLKYFRPGDLLMSDKSINEKFAKEIREILFHKII